MPLLKISPGQLNKKYSLELLIAVMDEAGAPRQTWKLANSGDHLLVIGANGKLGLLCACGARHKIGNTGKITGIVKSSESRKDLKKTGIYDEVFAVMPWTPSVPLKICPARMGLKICKDPLISRSTAWQCPAVKCSA